MTAGTVKTGSPSSNTVTHSHQKYSFGKVNRHVRLRIFLCTTDSSFISVIEDAVDRYAFYSSDYPLVLSIENHCKRTQRDVMAQILVKILGNKLHRDPVDPKLKSMPSPESLKNKILIKDKKAHSVSKPTLSLHFNVHGGFA